MDIFKNFKIEINYDIFNEDNDIIGEYKIELEPTDFEITNELSIDSIPEYNFSCHATFIKTNRLEY